MFDWPEAVIEIETDGSDAAGVILNLLAEPEHLREVSARNAMEALRRHDWVYRWRQIFDVAGLSPTPAMEAREKRLSELGESARQDAHVFVDKAAQSL
jgi:DNA/RNA-binding domain of Phe-tRNA-synthetase-like protein